MRNISTLHTLKKIKYGNKIKTFRPDYGLFNNTQMIIMAKRIFLLEDDEGIRQVIELILNLENYEVTSFENVEKFMAANPDDVPDLFILDVMLPDGNGIEVCKELSTLQKDVPVVMMSAHFTSADIALSCSEASFIPKPFDLNTLINTVKRLMKDE